MIARLKRREFITLLGGSAAAAWPFVAKAQAAGKIYRVGILSPGRVPPGLLEGFQEGLRELGYVEGQNIAFEMRNAGEDAQQLAAFANELVALKVNVILAVNTPAAQAAKKATAEIPIIFTRLGDPVKSGLVSNLSRPGGNITGLSFVADELSGKRLALLREVLPGARRVAVLWYEGNAGATIAVEQMKTPSRELGLELLLFPMHDPRDLMGTFQAANSSQVEALIVVDDAVITRHAAKILSWAKSSRLVVISLYKSFAEAGALMAYGPNTQAMYRRAGYYVDRILKGANPGDLPVEQPIKFDLVINLTTAKALGLEIPDKLLALADEVIE